MVKIHSISDVVGIFSSKQKPRKLSIFGNDGNEYLFLLKSHEDTRLDERVMQLFSFLNVLVKNSKIQTKESLILKTYDVTPLTKEVGLIGFVKNCTTLFEKLRKYRQIQKIPLEIEKVESLKAISNYYELPLKEKLILFQKGQRASKGDDIAVILFQDSSDSVNWVQRRHIYTASLAMTSISGYVMGLGDRHFANIMIEARTAQLVHIDFGDCFEVAIHRDLHPEQVPFRLTRMLVKALGFCETD